MTIPLLSTEVFWTCPNCAFEKRTTETRPHLPMHPCAGLRSGLMAPMIRAGTKAKVTAVEREDYLGKESVRLHRGRPIMALVTTKDNGEDRIVFAPTARVRIGVR